MNQSVSLSDTLVLFLGNIRQASVTRAILKQATSQLTLKDRLQNTALAVREMQAYWYLTSGRLGYNRDIL